jgi:hypothetical protein
LAKNRSFTRPRLADTVLSKAFMEIEDDLRRLFRDAAAAGDMTKAEYDTDDDGVVDSADDADTVDGKHASDFFQGDYDAAYGCLVLEK